MSDAHLLVGILKPAAPLGYAIFPYSCQADKIGYLNIRERLTLLSVDSAVQLPAVAAEMVELSAAIEPHALVRKYSKKEIAPGDFFAKASKELLEQVIRPFVETALLRMVHLLQTNDLPLFEAKDMPNLYPEDRIRLSPITAEARLRFLRSETGTQYTFEAFLGRHKVNLQHPGNIILTREPCLYFSEKRIFAFDSTINGKFLIPFLKKESIEIPSRMEVQYFGTFIRKIVNRCEIEAEGFTIRNAEVEPTASLSLENDWQGRPVLVLMFNYGEKMVLANHPQKSITELHSGEQGFVFNRLKRKLGWEKQQREFLKSLGLHQSEATFKLHSNAQANTLYELVEWIIRHREQIENQGFTFAQNKGQRYCFELAYLRTSLKTGEDWYDLHIEVSIGGYTLPFYKFRDHLLHNRKEYILPDGGIFILPDEWFTRYREVMLFSRERNGAMSLRKYHYRLLQEFNFPDIIELIKQENEPEPFRLPDLQNVRLRPYQVFGYGWMKRLGRRGFGSLLADDMGLGKTLQVIAILASYYSVTIQQQANNEIALPEKPFKTGEQLDIFSQAGSIPARDQPNESNPGDPVKKLPCSLIVMPASLIHNWVHEITRFAPGLKVYVHTGAGRSLSKALLSRNHVTLTTYGTLRNDIDYLEDYVFGYVVLDESQNIKNPVAKTALAAYRLKGIHRIALTGTPVENSLNDLWSQMNFLNPGMLGSFSSFNTYYASLLAANPEHAAGAELLNMIQPFLLRRTKQEVAAELPPVTETVSYCTMEAGQQKIYEAEKSKIRNHILARVSDGSLAKSSVMVLRALMQLRQIASNPRLVDPFSEAGSGKFDEVTEKLETILAGNHKVLVFSSFVKHLNLFEAWCNEKGIRYALLTGSTTKREKVINSFKEDAGIPLFLISLKAGGVGLNLAEAGYVFILDPWWNPASEMQAIGRAHRIGQDKNVFVYRFITKDTVEEKIMHLQEKKRALAGAFVLSDTSIAGMSSEEVVELFA